jgi:Zn-dependent protease
MRQSIRLGTFFGVPVGVNWSVLLILALFAWEIADYVLPVRSGHPAAVDWVAGVIGAVVLFGSLLAHEVSHAVVARHNGVGVRSITLFVFGGVAQLEGEAHTPGADFRIAAVGPATSVVIAGVFGGVQALFAASGGHGVPLALLSWLWEINLLLAGFNLIPAAPLDGGRILRAGLWRRWDDHLRASVAASRAGRAFGIGLIGLGCLLFLYTGSISGLWSAVIGFFLYSGARGEEEYALVKGALSSISVAQVMTPDPPMVPGLATVAELVTRLLGTYRGEAVAITDEARRLSGVVTSAAVRAVPPQRHLTTSLSEIAVPVAELPVVHPEDPMSLVLERMASKAGNPALVLDADRRLTGIVTMDDVQRAASSTTGWRQEGEGAGSRGRAA